MVIFFKVTKLGVFPVFSVKNANKLIEFNKLVFSDCAKFESLLFHLLNHLEVYFLSIT